MDTETIFYIVGPLLAASAIVVSFLGLRFERFPGRLAPLVFLWFALLVGGATTFAVLHSQDEQNARASEVANGGEESAEQQESILKLSADPSRIAFDTTTLAGKPGKVTIDFDNPAPLEHDVAIEQNGKLIAVSKRIAEGNTSVSAKLAPGTYTFLCTVPGHAEAGMEGTLTVR